MTDLHDRLTAASLRADLAQHPFVTEVVYEPRLGSTNEVAKARASEGAPEGLLVITDEQTAGRGRLGRRWWAPAGSSLLISLLFRPAMPPGRTSQPLHLVHQFITQCALAAADAVIDVTGLAVDLKWPNDLLIGDRKLAGLLAESVFEGDRLDCVVVGLGLNVNTDLVEAPPFIALATSLRLELGYPVDRLPLLGAYLNGVAKRYADFKAGISAYDEWGSRLITLGQRVTARLSDQTPPEAGSPEGPLPQYLTGIAQDVDIDGALLLRTADGTVHRLMAADISLQDSDGSRSLPDRGKEREGSDPIHRPHI